MLAGGAVGCAEYMPQSLRDAGLGGVVVGPFTRAPRRGAAPPRFADATSAFILETGLQNRGVRRSIERFQKVWRRLDLPVIAQLADRQPEDLARALGLLEASQAVAAVELLVHPDASSAEVASVVEGIADGSELPLLVKLPHATAASLAPAAAEAGADAIVISQPPAGMLGVMPLTGLEDCSTSEIDPHTEAGRISGQLYAQAVFPQILQALTAVASQGLETPLIACGGIHTWEDVATALDAGATAIQLDSAVWAEPSVAAELVSAWQRARAARPG